MKRIEPPINPIEQALKAAQRTSAWLLVIVLILIIYSSIPVAKGMAGFMMSHTPFEFLMNLIYAAIAYFFIVLFFWKVGLQKVSSFLLILITLAAYSFVILSSSIPVEKIHLIEYAVLAFLFFRALNIDLPVWLAWILAWVLTTGVGGLDELIQKYTPGRVCDIYDIFTNSLGGFFGLIFTAISVREKRFALKRKLRE